MDELILVMSDILSELRVMNSKLDDLRGTGIHSIDNVCSKLDDIVGFGTSNSLSDVCSKLDDIQGVGTDNSLSDICDKLDSMETILASMETIIDLK